MDDTLDPSWYGQQPHHLVRKKRVLYQPAPGEQWVVATVYKVSTAVHAGQPTEYTVNTLEVDGDKVVVDITLPARNIRPAYGPHAESAARFLEEKNSALEEESEEDDILQVAQAAEDHVVDHTRAQAAEDHAGVQAAEVHAGAQAAEDHAGAQAAEGHVGPPVGQEEKVEQGEADGAAADGDGGEEDEQEEDAAGDPTQITEEELDKVRAHASMCV